MDLCFSKDGARYGATEFFIERLARSAEQKHYASGQSVGKSFKCATNQKRIDQLRSTINDVAVDTQFNGKRLLTGLYGASTSSQIKQDGWQEPPKTFTMTPGKTYVKTVDADGSRVIIGKNNVENMTRAFTPTKTTIRAYGSSTSGGGLACDTGFSGYYSDWNWADAYKESNFTIASQYPVYFENTQSSPSTPQQVTRALMHSFDDTKLTGFDAFDEAINYATGGTIADKNTLVAKFMNDLNGSTDYKEFLKTYCDIILDNDDTGAITGSDAGGGSTKTAESVVPEPNVLVSSWGVPTAGSITTINNLRVHWPRTGTQGATFTDAEKHILAGLNSNWIEQSLNLVQETYGLDFNDDNTTVKDIYVQFKQENNDYLAYVSSSAGLNGKTVYLSLNVNMKFYADIDPQSADGGLSSSRTTYLDRTIAHEFTHAIMAANINNFGQLPHYVKEGTAELTHGIDDERRYTIEKLLTTDKGSLQNILQSGGSTSDGENSYAAGYMLLRYLATQGQGQTISRDETLYNEKLTPITSVSDMYETGVEIDFGASTMIDGSALTVPDSYDGQGFSILCGGCSQYINITFDKNASIGTGTLKTYSGSQRRDYTIGIGGATTQSDLAKAIFEGVKNSSGRYTSYDVYVEDASGNRDIACVSVDSSHNVRIAKNPDYPANSNAEYIFLKDNSPDMLFIDSGVVEATGGAPSKDDAPDGNATKQLDKYRNEVFDENGDPIPYEQVIRVDSDTPVKIWEPRYETVSHSEGNPLVIHSGTQANQHTNYFINDMQTRALTVGQIFKATADYQKSARTLIHTSDIERYNSLSGDPDKQKEWLDTLKAAENMSIDDISVTTVKDANIAIRVLDGALEYALDNATTLGAYLNRLETTETNVTTTEENTIASESTIRDADMAKEMTEYTKSNILMQASQAMLAQTNQNTAGILELLR